jgi:RND family efflux transporter MFP subunit
MKTTSLRILLAAAALAAGHALAQAPASVTVQPHEVDLTYPAEAVIEAVRQATVAAQVQGRVVEVRVDAGQKVRAGELLMRIDEREAAQGLAGAQATLINAEANLKRSRNLFTQKFISQAALDKAEADYKAAAAQAGQAGTVATFSNITSPISGTVAQRQIELGEMASPGRPLLTVFEPKGLRAIAEIPQYKFADVRRAVQAKVEFPELGRWVNATRVEVLPTADVHSHGVRARVYLPDDIPGVIPGVFARVHFVVGKARKLTLPAAAILRRGEISAVYVLAPNQPPSLRQVRLGEAVAGGDLEVLAGLSPGESVSLEPVKTGILLKQAPTSTAK